MNRTGNRTSFAWLSVRVKKVNVSPTLEQVASNLVSGPRGFPEIDRCEWFGGDEARGKLNPAQAEFIDRLLAVIAKGGDVAKQ